MNQSLCRGFTAAVLVGTAAFPLSASAEEITPNGLVTSQKSFELASGSGQKSFETPSSSDRALASSGALTDIRDVSTSTPESDLATQDTDSGLLESESTRSSLSVDVTAYTVDGSDMAILSIDSLPVLSFVEPSSETSSASKGGLGESVRDASSNPLARAESTAQQIEAFYQAEGRADEVLVRWEEDIERYAVLLDDEQLVVINEETQYFNATGEDAADALQATNRLRLLLGGAAPLTEIEGQPEPEPEPEPAVAAPSTRQVSSAFRGQASWYGPGFHGRYTASGEVFNQNAMTAAHRTLPFGTRVRVTNLNNNRQVTVRINDRGPFSRGRVIDLSAAAARAIGLQRAGVGPVRVEVLN